MTISSSPRNVRVRVLIGCGLVGMFCWQMGRSSDTDSIASGQRPSVPIPPIVRAGITPVAIAYPTPIKINNVSHDELAKTDPLGFLKLALQRYHDSVSDYTCVFTKQERIRGKLGQEQQIQVRFREMPFSVLMAWTRNPDQAKRVLYVQGKWQDDEGQPLAKIEPESSIARLLVKSVMLPINGSSARAASRRTIDQFGFGNALKLIIDCAGQAISTGQGSLTYEGEGTIDGRKTWVFKRVLPYTHDGGQWPDRVLIVHIDREWLLPVACQTYADDAQQTMLARYVFSDIHLNSGLSEKDFSAEANGF